MIRTNKYAMLAMMSMAMFAQANVEGSAGGSVVNISPEDKAKLDAAATTANATDDATTAADRTAIHTKIKANFNNEVDVQDVAFHFRKVKDEATKLETKRPTVTIPLPAPSVEGVVAILEGGNEKQISLLLEALRDKIIEQAREIINEKEDISEANFPYEKLSWEAIANLPKAERRGGGISKELWEDFAADYVAVMPAITGKTKESVELAARVFTSKFANAKTNKPVLKLLQGQLTMYINATTQGEQLAPVLEWLTNKLETLINTDETNLLNSLL